MGASLSSFLLYFLGIATVLVGGAGIALLYQTTGIRLHRPRIKPISVDDFPNYLLPVYEDVASQLLELGFVPLHYTQSQDVVVHEHDTRWCMVMVNRQSKVFAEISPASTFLAMPGVEVDFWSIGDTGNVLLTMNAKSHTLLGEIPGVQIHDPMMESIPAQYQAHLHQLQVFRANHKLVLPSSAVFIKLQQKLLDAYFLELIKNKTIVSTGNNQFRITIAKSFSLTGRFLKGETLIQRLVRTRNQRKNSRKETLSQVPQAVVDNQGDNLIAESFIDTPQYPVDAEVYSYLRLQSVNESRTTGMLGKVLIFMVTLVISYFVFGLAFSYNSVFILLAVILLHELGHIFAMHIFKYRDLQILFLPLLGAASTGKNDNVAVWKQVIVYLMGPLPGIILGLILIILNKDWGAPLVYETATIMLVINYVNLLPIVPMDGGHIVRLTFMERFPTGKLIFLGFSIAAFAAGGFFLSAPVFWVIALVMLAAFPMARMETKVLKILNQQSGNIDSLDVRGRLRKVFEALKRPQFHKMNFSGKYNLVKSLSEVILQQRHCSLHTSMSLTGVYLTVLLLTPPAIVVSTVGLDKTTKPTNNVESSAVPAKNWDAEILSTKDSHERFELLIQASQYYSTTTDLYKSGNYLKQAESMANSLNDEDMIARVDHAYALYYQGKDNYAKAESYLEQAINIGMRRSEKNYLQISTHFQTLASLKYQQNNMKDYESDLITSLLFAKKIQTPNQRYIIGNIVGQLLDYYYQNKQYETIQVLLQQTLKDFDKRDSAPFTTYIVKFVHRELGWFYTIKGNYKAAIKQYDKVMALTKSRKKSSLAHPVVDPMENTNLLLDIALAQYKEGNIAIAKKDLQESIQLIKKNNFDSLEEYIETYYPSENPAANNITNIAGLNLDPGDSSTDIGSSSRETERWRMIRDMSQALNQPVTAANTNN